MFDLKQNNPYYEEANLAILESISKISSEGLVQGEILDVGCGSGRLGYEIMDLGFKVSGIESNFNAADKAQKRLDLVINHDLTDFECIKDKINGREFDIIIFSDVLEHLVDPLYVLKKYIFFLKPGGRIIISIPNIANWQSRILLLLGYFNYTDSGVMDRTHVRFFTLKTAKLLIQEANLNIEKINITPYITRALLPIIKLLIFRSKTNDTQFESNIVSSPLYKIYLKIFYPVEKKICFVFKELFSFQFIFVTQKIQKK